MRQRTYSSNIGAPRSFVPQYPLSRSGQCAGYERELAVEGETRHSLARAVFLHQLEELRDRVAETMAYRACGLNLVVNAIILWNTVYLSRAVRFVREQGVDIQDHLLAQVAPSHGAISASPETISGTRLTTPSNASVLFGPTTSIQKLSSFLSGYYGTKDLGAPNRRLGCTPWSSVRL